MRHLVVAIFAIMTVWALLFYAYILDEVYDNVDDGLRDHKITILRAAYEDTTLLTLSDYGVNQFRITPADHVAFNERNTFSNQFFYMPFDDEEEPYRVLTTMFFGPDKRSYQLEIRASTVERDDLIIDLSTALLVLYIAMVLSIYLLKKYILTRAWRPFKKILDDLDAYNVGRTTTLAPVETDVFEFHQLHQHIGSMVERNAAVFADQKLFIENASHELQTPLAITINKIDMIMEDNETPPPILVKLAEAKKSLQRLIDLNRSLLFLSRIENRQFLQNEEVDLHKLTQELVENFNDIAAHKNISIEVQSKALLLVKGNRTLLTMALSNLIRNAIRYTEPAGSIYIMISANCWEIRNSSTAGALPDNYIFNRFYKGSDSIQSNGLGLSLVKSILQMTPGGNIQYTFDQKFHIFSVIFKNS
ncbi:HAMP domain-containing histidine kinase [Sphingobacterium sp. lm-10]|uniref:sensor histidine kinase n=1 Tax=Sphingobacterium sp. lm-10 TaxID=2944904 RepID=UPI002022925D|nr:HAMP domain-containing sensor histidine kinase [Sphingobacterium sp. lm-10]MCL7987852.1 HAMP domain-containing histidine kinase [Sphingobacterium sp. lm-10]